MKCIRCAAWTQVRETRKSDEGYGVKRYRVCANGHSFPTFEVSERAHNQDRTRRAKFVATAKRRAALYQRNMAVRRAVAESSQAQVVKHFGLSKTLVSWIVRKWKT